MKASWRRVLVAVSLIALAAVALTEHGLRRIFEKRYREAVDGRLRLERQFGEMLATHGRLKQDLTTERTKTQELANSLKEVGERLQTAQGRLSEQKQTVSGLESRLSHMAEEMNQLQGELAANVEAQAEKGSELKNAVEIERIVVEDTQSPAPEGRIVSVHKDWNFVVINLGWDLVRIGDTLSIVRDNQVIGNARVERVQEGMSAATVIPKPGADSIEINDRVRIL